MAAAWTRLIEMGLDVRVIRSTPWLRFEPEICLARSKNWVNDCAPSRSSVFKPDLVQATAETLKLNVLDLSESLRDSAYCPIVLGGVLVYRDKHHFTETFAKTLSTAIEEQLLLRSSD